MIELREASYSYDGPPVLDRATLTLPDARVTALIGPNGAGKSTALRLMAGLLKPQSGELRVDGQSPAKMPRRELSRRVAYLPQERPVPALTVEALAAHGRYAHRAAFGRLSTADADAIDRALTLTGMQNLRGRDLRTLSGGQRQKAYLALLIAQDTRNLLLDEPFTHLDIGFQLELCALLRALAREGRCVGVVLHDLALAPRLCDQAVLMQTGRVTFAGKAADCLQSPAFASAFGVTARPGQGIAFEPLA